MSYRQIGEDFGSGSVWKAGEDQHGTSRGQQIPAKASGKDVERRARDPNLTDNLGVFVLCLQPHSNAIPTRLSAPQHSRKFAAVGEGTVAMETDACCSSPPLNFSTASCRLYSTFHKSLLSGWPSLLCFCGANKHTNKQTKPFNNLSSRRLWEVTRSRHMICAHHFIIFLS